MAFLIASAATTPQTLLIEQRVDSIRQAAAELHQIASVIRARSNPLPDYPSVNNTEEAVNTTTGQSSSNDNQQSKSSTASTNQQHQSLLFTTGNETGSSFALPSSTKVILSHIQVLASNLDSFIKVGIVIESLAESLWTIISHIVQVGSVCIQQQASANHDQSNNNSNKAFASTNTPPVADDEAAGNLKYHQQQQQQSQQNNYNNHNNDTTNTHTSTKTQQQQHQQSQKAARQAFVIQAPLITSCVALWDSLSKRFTSKIFHAPLEQGKQGIVAWCEKLTNNFFSITSTNESSDGTSTSSKDSSSSSTPTTTFSFSTFSSLHQFFSAMNSMLFEAATAGQESYFNNSNSGKVDKHQFGVIYVDAVIALWTLLESCCNCLERTLIRSTKSVSSSSEVTLRLGEVSEFYTAAASYFLGSGARSFAKESNNAATLRWCNIAMMTFLPIVDEYFNNGHDVQAQFLFEHLPEVMMRRFSTEQISVVCAFLFSRSTNNNINLQQRSQQQQQQYQQNQAHGGDLSATASNIYLDSSKVAQVNANNMRKLTKSLRDNTTLIEAATNALIRANTNTSISVQHPQQDQKASSSESKSTTATPTSSTPAPPLNFYHQPVKAFICCLLGILTLPAESEIASPDVIEDFDSASTLLSLAFRRCIIDACGTSNTNNSDNETSNNNHQDEVVYDASAAMARLIFTCMVQRLDILRRTVAVRNGFAPWDNRFQLFSSNSRHHNSFLVEQMKRIVVETDGDQQQDDDSKKVSFTLLLSKIIMEWCSKTLLEYPAPSFYQSPLLESTDNTRLTGRVNFSSSSPFVLFIRGELLRCVTFPFVDISDLVAAQDPDCAHLVSLTLLKSLMKTATVVAAAAAVEEELNSPSLSVPSRKKKMLIESTAKKIADATTRQTSNRNRSAGSRNSSSSSNRNSNNRQPFLAPASTLNVTIQVSNLISVQKSPSSSPANLVLKQHHHRSSFLPHSDKRSLLEYRNYQQFMIVRVNQCVAIIERVRRSAFTAIDAAEPWGKLIPRRLYAETSLTFYDVIALCFAALAGDALSIKSNNAFVQAMLKVTRKLIPLAQPFCRAALESPATVDHLIDRFEKSMADVEKDSSDNNSSSNNNSNNINSRNNKMFRYLVASFTLSGMTDQQGMRVMPNQVFAGRWVPLLSRACKAIESDDVTRSVLEVHCRSCCSALLRSRRTVCPHHDTSNSSCPSSSSFPSLLYAGAITTNRFLREHISLFLKWIVRPVVFPARAAANRKMSGATFASHFSPCIFAVERLENEDGEHVGSEICQKVLNDAGRALVSQIRQITPQIQDPYQRDMYMDGNTRYAEGIASCIACLDGRVREVVKYYVHLIMSSLLVVFSMDAKRKVRDMMVQAVGTSKHLRGEQHLNVAMWIAEKEASWLREDGSLALMNRNNNNNNMQSAVRYYQSKI